jgi:hypothetical protein
MKQPLNPRVVALVRALGGNRKLISLTYLAHLAAINPVSLHRYLDLRTVRDALQRNGWHFTDSKALNLPPLEKFPFSMQFLVRNARSQH